MAGEMNLRVLGELNPNSEGNIIIWVSVLVLILSHFQGFFSFGVLYLFGISVLIGLIVKNEDNFAREHNKVGITFKGNNLVRARDKKRFFYSMGLLFFLLLALNYFQNEIISFLNNFLAVN